MEKPSAGIKELQGCGKHIDFKKIKLPKDDEEILDGETFLSTAHWICETIIHEQEQELFSNDEAFHKELHECLLNLPPLEEMDNPITINNIVNHQATDLPLQQKIMSDPVNYQHQEVEGYKVIHSKSPDLEGEPVWKIVIPSTLLPRLLTWYHLVLGHCGQKRLYDTVRARFQAKNLQRSCVEIVNKCPKKCQLNKQSNRIYGHLPPRTAGLLPWETVPVNLIGPWKVKVNNVELKFHALTCIDPVSNVVEAIRISNKTSEHITEQFENCWLSRYPCPIKCIHDNGGEFIRWNFQEMLTRSGIRSKPTSVKNPQSNAMCELMHKTIADICRNIVKDHPPVHRHKAEQKIDNALLTCVHALRCAVNHMMKTSPGAMVFNRDMLMNVQLIADLASIRGCRQQQIDNNVWIHNKKRIDYNYWIGELVKMRTLDPSKLSDKVKGPYRIIRVNTNSTVLLRIRPHITTTVNIRNIEPYKGELWPLSTCILWKEQFCKQITERNSAKCKSKE